MKSPEIDMGLVHLCIAVLSWAAAIETAFSNGSQYHLAIFGLVGYVHIVLSIHNGRFHDGEL